MSVGGLIGIVFYLSWENVAVFLALCALTLCGGHSLGMHRKLIHDSFECPRWLLRFGVYLGTLVGLGGPHTMMYSHDLRDWAQRQNACHSYLRHGEAPLKDFWWQVHCDLELDHPPDFLASKEYLNDPVLRVLQRTSILQNVLLTLVLFSFGGIGLVLWGVCLRVAISIFGHWAVGYVAHNHGPCEFHNEGAAVQGHNVPGLGLMTFGECWHNNHHAFPESAKLGLMRGQSDPGWWVLKALEKMGLVSNLNVPNALHLDVKTAATHP